LVWVQFVALQARLMAPLVSGRNSPVASSTRPARINPLLRRRSTARSIVDSCLLLARIDSSSIAEINRASFSGKALLPASLRRLRGFATRTSFNLR